MMKTTDMHIKGKFHLGTSLESILNEKNKDEEGNETRSLNPLINHILKGFNAEIEVFGINNFKTGIMSVLKEDSSDDELKKILAGFAPLFMVEINGEVAINFENSGELRDHPMAQHIFTSVEDLCGMVGKSFEEMVNLRIDMNRVTKDNALRGDKDYRRFIKNTHVFLDTIDDSVDRIEIAFTSPEHCVTGTFLVESEGLGKTASIIYRSSPIYERAIELLLN